MIPKEQLRIGNYVMTMSKDRPYLQIKNGEEIEYASMYSNPMPLDPTILEKCGFENVGGNEYYNIFERGGIQIFVHKSIENSNFVMVNGSPIDHYTNNIFLHNIQNLCSEINGEELEIKF